MKQAVRPISSVEWFVEQGNSFSLEGLAEALSADGFGYDSLVGMRGVCCSDGVPRDFFRIPSHYVAKIKKVKQGSDVLKFRFWKRNGPDAVTSRADFVEQSRGPRASVPMKKYRSGAEKLRAEREAREKGPDTSDPLPF